MKISKRVCLWVVACAVAWPGLAWAQDGQGVPAPPPPDQTGGSQDQSAPPLAPPPDQSQAPASAPAPAQAPAPDQSQGQPPPDQGQDQPPDQGPPQDATFQTFYNSLAPMGTWIQSSDYGYVWQPNVNDPDWAPYTEGHWVYSDAGWTWASDEPWGWATYHYGRWANLNGYGWCWVPGYTWGPGWVSWRYGDGYAGWAPLPPDSFYGIDYMDDGGDFSADFHIGGDCDFFFGIGPGCYNFIPVTCFGYRNYHGYYAHRWDNYGIINHTTNVTNINVSRNGEHGRSAFGGVTVGGPSLAQVNAVAETPVARVTLASTNQVGGGKVYGHTMALYAPRVDSGTRTTAHPGTVGGTIAHTAINRGNDVSQPLVVNQHLAPSAPSEAQIEQARTAQSQAPPDAKVVTAHTVIQPVFTAPLTSLRAQPPAPPAAQGAQANGNSRSYTPQEGTPSSSHGPVVYPQDGGHVYQPVPGYHQNGASSAPSYYSTPGSYYHSQSTSPPSSTPNYSAPGSYYHSQPSSPPSSTPPGYAPQSHSSSGGSSSSGQQGGNYHSGNSSGSQGSQGSGSSGGGHSGGSSGGNSGGGHGNGNGGGGGNGNSGGQGNGSQQQGH